jgi:G patch domain-containing protein 1
MVSNTKRAAKPVLLTKKTRRILGVQRCHDGRLPLEGFVFGREPDDLITNIDASGKFPPPEVPEGWVPARQLKDAPSDIAFVSTADAAKASTLDAKARAALLGEAPLKGKSVFDFLTAAARDRVAVATGRTDLPQAKGEVPEAFRMTEQEKAQHMMQRVPRLDRDNAMAALARGAGAGAPYADDAEKRSRYRAYLEYEMGSVKTPPPRPPKGSDEDWLRELHEFYSCARIFKPMTGLMASRFTSATSAKLPLGSSGQSKEKDLVAKPAAKTKEPAEEAAALGMFGPLTRSVADFYPTRLLCKRFNVKLPAHVQPDEDLEPHTSRPSTEDALTQLRIDNHRANQPSRDPHPLAAGGSRGATGPDAAEDGLSAVANAPEIESADDHVDTTHNAALEGKRAGEEVFRAIFGDSDEDG